jgi:hypothetical protein
LVVDLHGRPWGARQAGISNISIELTLGITSLCLPRGFFLARLNAANEPWWRLADDHKIVREDLCSLLSAEHDIGIIGEAAHSLSFR